MRLDDWFARELPELHRPWTADAVEEPQLVALDDELALELGLDPDWLRSPDGVAVLAGNVVPPGATPVAQAYAGHQFGGFSPRLGDGRALLLGEVVDPDGRHRDVHLKGSGATPFSRGGDGKATLGPMLREFVMARAMHALGVPTTRSLAVVATGRPVMRDRPLPGAVLTRVASSHLRVGTFQYTSMLDDVDTLRRLADHAIARHHPELADTADDQRSLALFDAVLSGQADLVARWMSLGFVHGVLNTDNVSIAAETIDYGPCAFMEQVDPATVFSSIDHGGRYAFGNQPPITAWNLARLAEALLPLIHEDRATAVELATEVLQRFPDRYRRRWLSAVSEKIGLRPGDDPGDDQLVDELWAWMETERVDLTTWFRSLSSLARGEADPPPSAAPWVERWLTRLDLEPDGRRGAADRMDLTNPVYVPRNHLVEEALDAATDGDLHAFDMLDDVVTRAFDERDGLERYAAPAPPGSARHVTFCGT